MAEFKKRTPLEPPPVLLDWERDKDALNRWLARVRELLAGQNDQLRQGTRNALTIDRINPEKGMFFVETLDGDAGFTDQMYFDANGDVFFPNSIFVAATVNADKRAIANISAFRAYQNTGQTIADNTNTVMTYNAEEFDEDTAMVVGTGVFTAKQAGKYHFTANVSFQGIATLTKAAIALQKNGAGLQATSLNYNATLLADDVNAMVCDTVAMAVGDTMRVLIYQNSGGNFATNGLQYNCYFAGFKAD